MVCRGALGHPRDHVYFDDYHYLQSRISVFHIMCHDESTALSPSTMLTNAIADGEINSHKMSKN